MSGPVLDLLVVGAGPTGIAIGAEARHRGLDVLVVDQGPLCASLEAYPADLEFFTTRERLEIAGVPFTIPEVKPNRRQALVYYREVVKRHGVPLALYEPVTAVEPIPEGPQGERFVVRSVREGRPAERRARAVALAIGYFWNPKRLGVPGEDLPWVRSRYVEPYRHVFQRVVVVGAGNSAAKTALDLWRNDARVTLVHRGPGLKPSVKYWIKPDLENRIAEGSIAARFDTRVVAFADAGAAGGGRGVVVEGPGGREALPADAVYVQIGYLPDCDFERRAGIEVDPESAIPTFDPETCETNVPGLYVTGTIQAGRFTGRIFIENSRDHGAKIVAHLARRVEAPVAPRG